MKKPELYKWTVDTLYEAYFNDTLQHGNCYACAVGNLAAKACNYVFKKDERASGRVFNPNLYWEGFTPYKDLRDWRIERDNELSETLTYHIHPELGVVMGKRVKEQFEKVGYTFEELEFIEKAFEDVCFNFEKKGEDLMLSGLYSVLEALKEIHEVDDISEEKERFSTEHKRKLELV